jgi:cell division inhibitor SulA
MMNAATAHNASIAANSHIHSAHVMQKVPAEFGRAGNGDTKTRTVSEVIIPSFTDNSTIISPIIASLTQQTSDRWTTWITSRVVNKTLLESLGANLSRLRIVHVNANDDARWVIWQALAQGNSHNVIAEQTCFDACDIEAMEVAATEGKCHGILISCK